MNLKEFTDLCGLIIEKNKPKVTYYPGRYYYTTRDHPDISTYSFNTAKEARTHFVNHLFGKSPAKAILKLLEGEENA